MAAASSEAGSSALPRETLALYPAIVKSFRPAKVLRSHITPGRQFTSLGFDDTGEYMITAADDANLQILSCRQGKHKQSLPSLKYGCHLARFTHTSSHAIYASTKGDDAIRYLSLKDCSFVRYFKGHTSKVTSLEMSPVDDQFLSAAKDDTVRLWDLRMADCQGCLKIPGHTAAAFDPTGAVFAVALQFKSTLLMYDMRNFDKAPFHSESINDPILTRASYPPQYPIYTALKFSNNGLQILAVTAGPVHYVLDSFNGSILARLEGHTGMEKVGTANADLLPPATHVGVSVEEACWTPDSRYVMSGTPDGQICIWDVNPPEGSAEANAKAAAGPECTLQPITKLDGSSGGAARCVAFNPRLAMFATGGLDLGLWLPNESLE